MPRGVLLTRQSLAHRDIEMREHSSFGSTTPAELQILVILTVLFIRLL